MSTALAGAVELLEGALAYTRVALARCEPGVDLARRTPCADWTLGDLLAHMEDALDAFTEAAGGTVGATPGDALRPRVDRIRAKACTLLGAWSGPTPADVGVGGHAVATDLLVSTAALEITVHGWDVGEALGGAAALPDDLATRLLVVSGLLVHDEDRAVRFSAARSVHPDADPGERLLAFLGRGTGTP